MTDFPIWMTQEQADRLKTNIEAEGFSDVEFMECDGGTELGVTAKAGGKALSVIIADPQNLASVVYNLKKIRDHRANEGKDLAQEPEGK